MFFRESEGLVVDFFIIKKFKLSQFFGEVGNI